METSCAGPVGFITGVEVYGEIMSIPMEELCFDELAEHLRWSDTSIISILRGFIDKCGLEEELNRYAQECIPYNLVPLRLFVKKEDKHPEGCATCTGDTCIHL